MSETPVPASEKQREPHLSFAGDEPRISGSGGCNRVTDSFELAGDQLRIGRPPGTIMARPPGMEQEQRFLQMPLRLAAAIPSHLLTPFRPAWGSMGTRTERRTTSAHCRRVLFRRSR